MKNYAKAENVGLWSHHPVMGDVSFDAFEKVGDTVHISTPPYEWAVNGSLYCDKNNDWYLYAGLYPWGYGTAENGYSHFRVYRSQNEGKSWELLPEKLSPNHFFEGAAYPSNSCPDAVLFWDEKRGEYLLTYDWSTVNFTWEKAHSSDDPADSGAALAFTDSPAGPFTRNSRPVYRTSALRGKFGKFDRFYATTVIPRKDDYLALVLCDSGPHYAWGLICLTSKDAQQEFENPTMLLCNERAGYYPTPMEYYPAFVVGDTVYAPATSVARSRNYQFLFAAKLEEAHRPEAWQMVTDGSLWHSRPLADEAYGIWGQTVNGFVKEDKLTVMYASRNEQGMGTLSVASRPWSKPVSDGFTVSGHDGPSVVCLQEAYTEFDLNARFTLQGSADFLFDFAGKIGPDIPQADSIPCPEALTEYTALRIAQDSWALVQKGNILAGGSLPGKAQTVHLARKDGKISAWVNQVLLFDGMTLSLAAQPLPLGIRTGCFSVLECSEFTVTGDCCPAAFTYTVMEAVLGAGVKLADLTQTPENLWVGQQRVKWNPHGSQLTVLGVAGPQYGEAVLQVDGEEKGVVSFFAPEACCKELFTCTVKPGAHGVELLPKTGVFPIPELKVQL